MSMAFIGIDNGVSGSIGIIKIVHGKPVPTLLPTPTIMEQDYTKKKKNIGRIDHDALIEILEPYKDSVVMLLLERPMVNPGRFAATASALRAHESTLLILEKLKIPFAYIDSKEWQKELLPSGISGAKKLKEAGVQVANRIYPTLTYGEDADGLLIAEYNRRKNMPTTINRPEKDQ